MSTETDPHELPEWAKELGADLAQNRPPGLEMGSYEGDVEQTIPGLTFSRRPHMPAESISEVPPRFVSEAIRDVERILSRG